MNANLDYIGQELDYFQHATRWKKYWTEEISKIIPEIFGLVEIGSGIGSNSPFFKSISGEYLGIEPDKSLVSKACQIYPRFDFLQGDVKLLGTIEFAFNCVAYIDVLEHIEFDLNELTEVTQSLKDQDFLILLVPAHNILFSDFDKSVGHFRRYEKSDFLSLNIDNLKLLNIKELDSIGYVLSRLSKLFFNSSKLNLWQVKLWDFLIPISRKIDYLIGNRIGKSILVVYKKK